MLYTPSTIWDYLEPIEPSYDPDWEEEYWERQDIEYERYRERELFEE